MALVIAACTQAGLDDACLGGGAVRAQEQGLVPVGLAQAPERVLAQEQEAAGQVRELARAPVHRLAAPVPGPARELGLARAAQVPGPAPAQVQGRALQAHPQAPAPGLALERAPEAELAAVVLAVVAAPEPRVLQAVQQAPLVLQRGPLAVVPDHLLLAMAAPAPRPRREARREASASRAFGDAFSGAGRTARRRRPLPQQDQLGLRQMRCTR
jgi:hypothetical protein